MFPGDLCTDWYNFGFWDSETTNFERAAAALAIKHGQLADLNTCSHLLDIGPGRGAQLALWKEIFNVQKVTALEPNRESWQRAKAYETKTTVLRCEKLEDFSTKETFQCVVAVDSCYHIPYSIFWNKLLQLSGLQRVVVSDLFLLRMPSLTEKILLRIISLTAKIPYGNFRTKDEYIKTSEMMVVSWDDLSVQVVDGFCNFVTLEILKRTMLQRVFDKQLIKVNGTSLLLRWLRSKGLLGFALIAFEPM